MSVDITELQSAIVTDLTDELSGEPTFSATALNKKVKLAILDVMSRRNYEYSNYSDKQIEDDLTLHYYATITNLARFDYNQIGAEGQTKHDENSVSRTWADRDSLLRNVHAFVKVF